MGATANAAAAAFSDGRRPSAASRPEPQPGVAIEQERLLETDVDKLVSMVEQAGIEWANADETASLLEETKKTMLAQFTLEAQRGSGAAGAKPIAMVLAEAMAMGRPEYKGHLDSMVKARSAANRAKVRYDSGRVKLDLYRTLAANERAARQFSGART